MPRGARLILKNVYYHVINRGNQKQRVFLEDADFEKYLELLKRYKKKYNFKNFGYCLMPNHVHIIIGPREEKKLSRFMQGLNQTYTAWFNKKYKKSGHLWQGRFKSKVINKDSYFIDCVYYVEANPVRAGLVNSPAEYPWSSYRERIFGNKEPLIDVPDST